MLQTERIKIAICIVSCLRPKGLKMLLNSLSKQEDVCLQQYAIRIVVVDNDLTGKNDQVVEACRESALFPLTLIPESKRGIPHARNRAIEEAWDDDALIFVDDDEFVPLQWLSALLRAWEDTSGDIVTGPVYAKLPEDTPNWAIRSNTYSDIRNHPTGTLVHKAYTNNTLISQNVFQMFQPAFDPFFCFSGSEDINFFSKSY